MMFGKMLGRQCFQLVRMAAITSPAESQAVSSILKRSLNKSLVSNFRGVTAGVSASHQSSLVQVQRPAPAFKGTAVVHGDFKDIDICDFKGQYLVLFFYPLDFTFVCPTEIIAFSDRIDEFKAINTAVVGVSCDSHFSHLAWVNTPRKHGGLGELKYPLLSDFNKTIARDYNVLLESDGVPLRGLFIIDPESVVRQITVNDLPVGRSVDEVLRLVKAFQFTDKHGEVECVDPKEDKVGKNLQKKFSIQNIKPKPSYGKPYRYLATEETSETKDLSVQQLERLVLLDQLKFYRMQMEDLQGKKEEVKKDEKSTVNLLQERDCIAV